MIPAIIGAVGGIASSLMGMFDNSAEDIAYLNYYEQQRQNRFLRWLANEQLRMAQAGREDARGNQSYYDPSTNTWKVDATDMTKQLLSASDREEYLRLTQDSARRRDGLEANYLRRMEEGDLADNYLDELRLPSPYTRQGIEDAYRTLSEEGINEGYDKTSNNLLRQFMRSGAEPGNVGKLLSQVNADRSKSLGSAKANAYLKSLEAFDTLEGNRTKGILDKYNLFATRASNFEDVPFAPTNVDATAQSNLAAGAALQPQLTGLAGSFLSRITPQMAGGDGGMSRYGLGIGSIGDALSGLYDLWESENQQDRVIGNAYVSGGNSSRYDRMQRGRGV